MEPHMQPENQPMNQQFNLSPQVEERGFLSNLMNKVFSIRAMLFVIIVMLGVLIFFAFKPPFLDNQTISQQVVTEVSRLVEVNPFEEPVVTVIADAENLRAANAIQTQVYANAQDGDYVLGYTDKMIIFRRGSNEIIYEGYSPGAILSQNQAAIEAGVIQAVKDAGLVSNDYEEKPQLRVIADPAKLQAENPTFYENSIKNDVVAVFSSAELIVIYRPDTGVIVKSGFYSTSISPI